MKTLLLLVLTLAAGLVAAGWAVNEPQGKSGKGASMSEVNKNLQTATFAGGCFWCVESDFEKLPGVVRAISGYTGGRGDNPTYDNYGQKGHVEAVQVVYDPAKVSYRELLILLFKPKTKMKKTEGNCIDGNDDHWIVNCPDCDKEFEYTE